MKQLTALLVTAIFLIPAFAQKNSSQAEELNIDGFKVIVKPTVNQVVSARFFIRGGTANYSKAQEGIEHLAMITATQGGTVNYPKDRYFTKLEKMGSTIEGSAGFDQANIALSCIRRNFDASWELFADVLLNAAFPEEEFLKFKEQEISNVKQGISDPDTYLNEMAMNDAFANLNYSKKPQGSEESLQKLTVSDVKNYYRSVISKKQCFLVVVGNIDKAALTAKVRNLVKNIPDGNYVQNSTALLNINQSTLNTEERKMATNYVRGVMNAPSNQNEEVYAIALGMDILHDRLFDEIRTKRGLSYAPAAGHRPLNSPYTTVYVSSTDPNQSAQVIIDELKKLKTQGFTEAELKNKKSTFLTEYYMRNETNASQSLSLGGAEIRNSWRNAVSFIDQVNKVTLKQLNSTFGKHINGIRWSYLGDISRIDSKIFLQKLN